jgi:undecaprenyl-diphosphatase
MSDIIKAVILGIVEGLTEFIPVSSTGHLILVGDGLSFKSANTATFEIAIQLGAILAVVVIYRGFFSQFLNYKNWLNKEAKNILVAILPALIMGFFFHGLIKKYLFSSLTVVLALLVGGVIMIIAEKFLKKEAQTKQVEDITIKQSFIIGISQCFALWPGMSRSGSTIVGGLLAGLDHKTSAKFSFIIAVPVMFAAVGYDILKSLSSLTIIDLYLISIGFVVSFFVALLAIVSFIKILSRFKLTPFAIYRILVSILLLLVLWL